MLSHFAGLDPNAIAASVVVFVGAIGTAAAGAFVAAKKVKDAIVDFKKLPDTPKSEVTSQQIVGGLLQDQFGSIMLGETMRDLKDEMRELRFVIEKLADRMDHGRRND